MLPIELVGDIAAGGAATVFPPSSLIFGAVKYFINAAKGVPAKFNAIIDMMETLKVSAVFDGNIHLSLQRLYVTYCT